MSRIRPRLEFLDVASRLLGFVASTQEIRSCNAGLAGGIRSSYLFAGGYLLWCVPNWGSKFFADSIIDYVETVSNGTE
jgi:hypothetical protein